jgi:hypothetical protein
MWRGSFHNLLVLSSFLSLQKKPIGSIDSGNAPFTTWPPHYRSKIARFGAARIHDFWMITYQSCLKPSEDCGYEDG